MSYIVYHGRDAKRFAYALPIKRIFESYEKPLNVSDIINAPKNATHLFAGQISIYISGIDQTTMEDSKYRRESLVRIFAMDKVLSEKDQGVIRRVCVTLNDGKKDNLIFVVPNCPSSNEQTDKSQKVCDVVCDCIYNITNQHFFGDVKIAVVFDGLPYFYFFGGVLFMKEIQKIVLKYLSVLM